MDMLKPKIIDKYIMKKFISAFFISLLLIITVIIIVDISEKIDDFVKNEASLHSIIFDYYLNFIPYYVNMFSPLFVFITVIFFTSRMAARSEIVAILSGGISYRRMLVPYMISAAIIALLSLVLNLYAIPRANQTRIAFEETYIDKHQSFASRNVHYQIAPGEFAYVESFSSWNNTAYKITLETIRDSRLVSKLSADNAIWDSTMDGWHMRNWCIREYSEGIHDKVTFGEQLDTIIALKVTDFYRNDQTVATLPIKELNQLIDTQLMRGDPNVMYAQIEKNTRYALPFSAFILTIMGVALTSRKKRGGIGWNIAIGIALAFLYILFLRFSQMFVFTGTLSPFIALWLPNIIYSIVALILYKIAPK